MELPSATPFVLLRVATALVFGFLISLHDSANSIATIVSTRVLAPRYAVVWATFFNFVAFLVFGLHVAGTVGSGIVGVEVIDDRVVLAALGGAIVIRDAHVVSHVTHSTAMQARRKGCTH